MDWERKYKNRWRGSWKCLKCENINYAQRIVCNMCKTPKLKEVEDRSGTGDTRRTRQENQTQENKNQPVALDGYGKPVVRILRNPPPSLEQIKKNNWLAPIVDKIKEPKEAKEPKGKELKWDIAELFTDYVEAPLGFIGFLPYPEEEKVGSKPADSKPQRGEVSIEIRKTPEDCRKNPEECRKQADARRRILVKMVRRRRRGFFGRFTILPTIEEEDEPEEEEMEQKKKTYCFVPVEVEPCKDEEKEKKEDPPSGQVYGGGGEQSQESDSCQSSIPPMTPVDFDMMELYADYVSLDEETLTLEQEPVQQLPARKATTSRFTFGKRSPGLIRRPAEYALKRFGSDDDDSATDEEASSTVEKKHVELQKKKGTKSRFSSGERSSSRQGQMRPSDYAFMEYSDDDDSAIEEGTSSVEVREELAILPDCPSIRDVEPVQLPGFLFRQLKIDRVLISEIPRAVPEALVASSKYSSMTYNFDFMQNDTMHTFKVKRVVSPSEFYVDYVLDKEDEDGKEFLRDDKMQKFYNDPEKNTYIYQPEEITICRIYVYFDPDLKRWMRVRALKVKADERVARVHYLDAEMSSWVRWEDLRELHINFSSVNTSSLRASMAYIEPLNGEEEWSEEVKKIFKECTQGKLFNGWIVEGRRVFRPVEQQNQLHFSVVLVEKRQGVCRSLQERFIKAKLAKGVDVMENILH